MGMGGGKFSYDVRIVQAGKHILRTRRFVRINTREIGYVAYVRTRRDGNKLRVTRQDGDRVTGKRIKTFLAFVERRLGKEMDDSL